MSEQVLKEITMTLDPDSIEKALQEVKLVQRRLEIAQEELLEGLAVEGRLRAMAECNNAVVDPGDNWSKVPESIRHVVFPEEKCAYIYSDDLKAVYMEYGTGIIGEMIPHEGIVNGESHPEPIGPYYKYDTFDHGTDGWFYYGDDGTLRHTLGSPPGMFMYYTFRWLRAVAPLRMKEMLGWR